MFPCVDPRQDQCMSENGNLRRFEGKPTKNPFVLRIYLNFRPIVYSLKGFCLKLLFFREIKNPWTHNS